MKFDLILFFKIVWVC